jgi:hypothetical protein
MPGGKRVHSPGLVIAGPGKAPSGLIRCRIEPRRRGQSHDGPGRGRPHRAWWLDSGRRFRPDRLRAGDASGPSPCGLHAAGANPGKLAESRGAAGCSVTAVLLETRRGFQQRSTCRLACEHIPGHPAPRGMRAFGRGLRQWKESQGIGPGCHAAILQPAGESPSNSCGRGDPGAAGLERGNPAGGRVTKPDEQLIVIDGD